MGVRQAKWTHRTVKQEEARIRKAESAKLTVDQRIARLDAGRQRAIKERARLLIQQEIERNNNSTNRG